MRATGAIRITVLILAVTTFAVAKTALLAARTADARFERDVSRMVYNDNLALLGRVRHHKGAADDSLLALLNVRGDSAPAGAIVISVTENRLWYRVRDSVVFETRVATGSGKILVKGPGGSRWKFETPRGRLTVQDKEKDPVWVPPDWHYVEQASKRKVQLTRLLRGQSIELSDGSEITVVGSDVVRRLEDGRTQPLDASDGREIVADGRLIVPPFGTNQRRYRGVLGTHRLILGDGYSIHGTNVPSSIGQSVSHGCVRLLNQDIAYLYDVVPVGTPVFIY
jgi:lipoprotein-anchoring transpeptidase ErfK/SrfK